MRAAQPLAILVENVPDALNYGGHNVMAEIAEALQEVGYVARYALINAAFHGVPQMRDRVFLIAYHSLLDVEVCFPEATHHLVLPSGYGGSRLVALKHIDLFEGGYYSEANHGSARLPTAVTCEEAIGDLPPIAQEAEGTAKGRARRFDSLTPYQRRAGRLPAYVRLMRNWPGYESRDGVWDHVTRCLPRDVQTFREMPNGAEYPAAHATATAIWKRRIGEAEARKGRELSTSELLILRKAIVPPYPLGSFPNRWWKLKRDAPSRTLMAHIGKDTYSHIHYDSEQGRVISVREAARLQSFPDGFRFCGTMNPAFRQIGNAAPPVLARRLAESILRSISSAIERPSQRRRTETRHKRLEVI